VTADDEALQRGHDLIQLRFHWGDAYEIGYDCASFWFRRRDNGAELRCATATALWGEIRRDYSAMPVPRDAMKLA
jgi:hypothetical protein